ncbi:MAG: hypothetical protein Q8Q11_00820 [bacterium]|nr:hypothetical protein [bacterium]MDZ4248295.1 hypothetical protein [Patescibacteria group bacterium]
MKKRIILVVIAVAVVGAAGLVAVGRSQDGPKERPSPSPTVSAKPAAKSSGTAKKSGTAGRTNSRDSGSSGASRGKGSIEGSLVYPGEGIPGDIRVCAANLATSREVCTKKVIRHWRFKSGRGYRLAVSPGKYQVYAVVPSFDPGYQAFYSAFVVCGYHAECTDHSPITIAVTAGKTRTNVDPGDFYDN